jgi:DNA polymerase III delta prime subunit
MNPKTLHHAYLIEGDRALATTYIEAFLREHFGIERRGNPDFWYSEHETFSVDEARELAGRHIERALDGGKKIFVIATRAMTHEAQNSLLKAFEEPTPDTHFFIVSPSRSAFLPTLLSRFYIVRHDAHSTGGQEAEARKFMKSGYKTRLEKAKELSEDVIKSEVRDFLIALLKETRRDASRKLVPRAERELVEYISYLGDRAPSVKLILERVALLVPVR